MLSRLKFPINSGNLYILLWCLYYMQGTLYPQGSIISQGILAILLIFSIYNCINLIIKKKLPIYFKGLNLLLLIFIIYGIIYIIYGEKYYIGGNKLVRNFNYLKSIFISILPIYSFYYFTIKKKISEKNIRIWSILFILVAICQYWFNYQKMTEDIVVYGSQQIEITNNIGYTFLAIFPLIFIWYKKPIIQYILLGIILFFIISGMKRGTIIIGAICMIWFLYCSLKDTSRNKKFSIILLCLILLYFAVEFIENMLATSDYFNQRINDTLEGNSSSRDTIYTNLLNHFLYKVSTMQFLFGCGANYTIEIARNYAHNDWLEIAINQGILGLIIYLTYWVLFARTILRIKQNKLYFSILVTFFIIYFTSTLFSMSYSSMSFMATLALGYCLAQTQKIIYDKETIHLLG